jgi:hypothetical protein
MPASAPPALLGPLFALVAITFAVWLRLFQLRFAEMRLARVAPQAVALSGAKQGLLQDTRASDNFANLFELPVLFYAGVLLALQQGAAGSGLVAAAWAFAALRALHSLIHCSCNLVAHRFVAYALGALALWAFWLQLALELLAP